MLEVAHVCFEEVFRVGDRSRTGRRVNAHAKAVSKICSIASVRGGMS